VSGQLCGFSMLRRHLVQTRWWYKVSQNMCCSCASPASRVLSVQMCGCSRLRRPLAQTKVVSGESTHVLQLLVVDRLVGLCWGQV
jgi:hypothetical protein